MPIITDEEENQNERIYAGVQRPMLTIMDKTHASGLEDTLVPRKR